MKTAKKVKKRPGRRPTGEARQPEDPHAAIKELIARTKARLDAQDQRDWEIQKQYEDQPMVGEATWHEHHG